MAELQPLDVQNWTKGRLSASDTKVQQMLTAALSVTRREVGWHVSPVKVDHVITLDGPDSRILWLPTLKLANDGVTSLVEDDVVLDPTTYRASAGDGSEMMRRVALRKRSDGWWTAEYGGIVVTMDHGFTEAEAADWREAILAMVDQMSLLPVASITGASEFGVAAKRVDDVQLNWSNPYAGMAEEVIFSIASIIDKYRLHGLEYL